MLQVAFLTTIFNATVLMISFKILRIFHFISWHPTAFLKTIESNAIFRWFILWIIICVITFLMYLIAQFIPYKLIRIFTLLVSLIFVLILNFRIEQLPFELASFKELSVPFIIVLLISFLFVFATASFHYTEKTFSHTK